MFKQVDGHTTQCWICWQMASRAYAEEKDFWEDWFNKRENPIKFILKYKGVIIKGPKKLSKEQQLQYNEEVI